MHSASKADDTVIDDIGRRTGTTRKRKNLKLL
jgi:hypothetical protein